MAAQMIELKKSKYALMPKQEYEQLLAQAHGVELPPIPEKNERGNRPATATARAIIGRGIITDRLEAGMTQQQLADAAGINVETLSRLESGKHRPQTATVQKLQRALGKPES